MIDIINGKGDLQHLTIKKGDTLWDIAKKYNSSAAKIKH